MKDQRIFCSKGTLSSSRQVIIRRLIRIYFSMSGDPIRNKYSSALRGVIFIFVPIGNIFLTLATPVKTEEPLSTTLHGPGLLIQVAGSDRLSIGGGRVIGWGCLRVGPWDLVGGRICRRAMPSRAIAGVQNMAPSNIFFVID